MITEIIINSTILAFISFLIINADIFLKLRLYLLEKLRIIGMNSTVKGWFANKAAYIIKCSVCQGFYLSCMLAFVGVFPALSPLYYPVISTIIYKALIK